MELQEGTTTRRHPEGIDSVTISWGSGPEGNCRRWKPKRGALTWCLITLRVLERLDMSRRRGKNMRIKGSRGLNSGEFRGRSQS